MSKFLCLAGSILFIILEVGCKKNPVTPPQTLADTTSHNFVVERIDTLGNWFSQGRSVEIINASDIWVGGAFTVLNPPTDYHFTYNLAHWNGQAWEMKSVLFKEYNNTGPNLEPIIGMKIFDDSSKFMISSFNSHAMWYNHMWTTYFVDPQICFFTHSWARTVEDIYLVGQDGTAADYNGGSFTKMTTGKSDLPLVDVWGDEKRAYTLGSSNDMQSNAIFYSDNRSSWTMANSYSISDKTLPPPHQYMGRLFSIFRANAQSKLWVLGGEGSGWLYEIASLSPFSANIFYKIPDTFFPQFVRGNADNDLFLIGSLGEVWHYNGSTWKLISTAINFRMINCAVKGNTIALVGESRDQLVNRGISIVLQRQ